MMKFFAPKNKNDNWNVIEKFSIEGIIDYSKTNEKSCTHLSPFAHEAQSFQVLVEREWYEARKELFTGLSCIKVVEKLPRDVERKSDNFKLVYKKYLAQYDYSTDMKRVGNDVKIIEIPLGDLKNILTDVFFGIEEIDETVEWYKELEKAIEFYDNRCFVRGERVSAKNDSGKQIISSAKECLLNLGKSKEVLKSLCEIPYDITYIAVMPWNEKITLQSEFRIYALDGVIRAISQQKWYIYVGLTRSYVEEITPYLYQGSMEILKKLNYLDVSMDVWIDDQKKVHLIEVNPGGRWCCSASMLFNWTDDDVWCGDKVYVRYTENSVEDLD